MTNHTKALKDAKKLLELDYGASAHRNLAACYIELHELTKEIITAWDAGDDVSGVVVRMRPHIKSIRKVLEEK